MTKIDPQRLTAWRLFITTHARLIDAMDRDLQTAGKIPLHWYDVLIELAEAPDRRLRMHDLAEKVVLSRSGLTRLVDKLEKAGYLRREIDPQDRRGFYAILTEDGLSAQRDAWGIYAKSIAQYFAQYLNDDDARYLIELFTKMLV